MSKIVVRPEKKELEPMYLIDGKTSHEIAEHYNCSFNTVLKWLHHYNIQLRKPGCHCVRKPYQAKQHLCAVVTPTKNTHKAVCSVLKDHAEDLKDDPERLSTEFLQRLIGVKC